MQGLWKTKLSGFNEKRKTKIKNIKFKHILKDKMDIILKKSRDDYELNENVYRIEKEMVKVGKRCELNGYKNKPNYEVPLYKVKIILNGEQVATTKAFLKKGRSFYQDTFEEIDGYNYFSKYKNEDIETSESYIGKIVNPYYEKELEYYNEVITKDFCFLQKSKTFLYNKPYNTDEYSMYRFYTKRPYANIANRKLRRRVKSWINKGEFEDTVYKNFSNEKSVKYDIL